MMMTVETFDQSLRPLLDRIIQDIRSHESEIVESPTRSYLGLKIANSLVCAFYPDPYTPSRRFFLGHWVPPVGGQNARWLKPPIQMYEDYEPLRGTLRARIDFLRGRVRTRVPTESEKPHSWRIPRQVLVENWHESEFVEHLMVLDQIGFGGMGSVFRGRRFMTVRETVAIKFLGAERRPTTQEAERFKREVRLLAQKLDHPNVIKCLGYSVNRPRPFFVMEYANAGSLRDRLLASPIPREEAIVILTGACAGVAHAHSRGVVHRDLKPENILQVDPGCWKVSDFGLCVEVDRNTASLTSTNVPMGTWAYMSDEQRLDAKRVDHRTDVFSLGVILYELLTGFSPPVRFSDLTDAALRRVVEKATARSPEDRFKNVEEFVAAAIMAWK